jgi:hypothetical protein
MLEAFKIFLIFSIVNNVQGQGPKSPSLALSREKKESFTQNF